MRASCRLLRTSLRGECGGCWEASCWVSVSPGWLVGLAFVSFSRLSTNRIDALSCFVRTEDASLWHVRAFQWQPGVQGLWNKSPPVRKNQICLLLEGGAYDGTKTARTVILRPDLIMHLIVKHQERGQNMKGNLFFHFKAHLLEKMGQVLFSVQPVCLVEKFYLLKKSSQLTRERKDQTVSLISYLPLLKCTLFQDRKHKSDVMRMFSWAVHLAWSVLHCAWTGSV